MRAGSGEGGTRRRCQFWRGGAPCRQAMCPRDQGRRCSRGAKAWSLLSAGGAEAGSPMAATRPAEHLGSSLLGTEPPPTRSKNFALWPLKKYNHNVSCQCAHNPSLSTSTRAHTLFSHLVLAPCAHTFCSHLACDRSSSAGSTACPPESLTLSGLELCWLRTCTSSWGRATRTRATSRRLRALRILSWRCPSVTWRTAHPNRGSSRAELSSFRSLLRRALLR